MLFQPGGRFKIRPPGPAFVNAPVRIALTFRLATWSARSGLFPCKTIACANVALVQLFFGDYRCSRFLFGPEITIFD